MLLLVLILGEFQPVLEFGRFLCFEALFSCRGSIHTRNAHDFLVATARLLTQGVGSSTGAIIANLVYRSNSSLRLSFSALGTCFVGMMTGVTLSSTSK